MAGNIEMWVLEPASTATEIMTTPEPARTAQMRETLVAWGTPGYRLEIGKMAEGTALATVEVPTTATRTPEEAEIAVWNPEGG